MSVYLFLGIIAFVAFTNAVIRSAAALMRHMPMFVASGLINNLLGGAIALNSDTLGIGIFGSDSITWTAAGVGVALITAVICNTFGSRAGRWLFY